MDKTTPKYSIGAASRASGVSTHTIRKWEDRYQAVEPGRSPGGDRRYSQRDVDRLALLGQLTGQGHSISGIAASSLEQLQTLAGESAVESSMESAPRIGVIGDSLPALVAQNRARLPRLSIRARAASLEHLSAGDLAELDGLIVEMATLGPSALNDVERLRLRSGVAAVIVAYRFGSHAQSESLSTGNTACVRLPLNFRETERTVMALVRETADRQAVNLDAPPRYSMALLARVAAVSPNIACECPRHLAELLSAVSHFESYSAQCASRNEQDARLHQYLGETSARVRRLYEQALEAVAAYEDIPLDQWRREDGA